MAQDLDMWKTIIDGKLLQMEVSGRHTWGSDDGFEFKERDYWINTPDNESVDAILWILHKYENGTNGHIVLCNTMGSDSGVTFVEKLLENALEDMIRDFTQIARIFEYICTKLYTYSSGSARNLIRSFSTVLNQCIKQYEKTVLYRFPTLQKEELYTVISYQIPWTWTLKYKRILSKS